MTEGLVTTEQPAAGTGRSWRWRGTYFAGLVLAVAGLVTGLASATLNATGSGTGSASTGSVALSINAAATRTCTYGSLLPGDLSGSATCALSVTYTGSLPAFVSLTVQIRSMAGPGGSSLYNGTNTSGLTLSISDGHRRFTVPAGTGRSGGSCPSGFTCWTAPYDLAAWYSGATPNLTFSAGDSATFTVTPLFPKTVGNAYQGGTATVNLTAQAVQAAVNPLPAGCTTTTIGQPCPGTGTFTWS